MYVEFGQAPWFLKNFLYMFFFTAVNSSDGIFCKVFKVDPDPHWERSLIRIPNEQKMNADPQPNGNQMEDHSVLCLQELCKLVDIFNLGKIFTQIVLAKMLK